jgi:hypothetical protein
VRGTFEGITMDGFGPAREIHSWDLVAKDSLKTAAIIFQSQYYLPVALSLLNGA